MKYYKHYPVTLAHFLDRPLWAVACGYDYNFLDCLSWSANIYGQNIPALLSLRPDDVLSLEIREIPMALLSTVLTLLFLVLWPLTYPVWAVVCYWLCKRKVKQPMNDVRDHNLSLWLYRFNRERR